MISPLYERVNYISNIPFVFSRFIREYDISKANISILYSKNIITKDVYERLYNSPRMVRQVYVGNLQKSDKKITKALQDGIIEAKKNLFISNNINPGEVLSIKNDAVFIIGRELQYTKFDMIRFDNKNTYTSFVKLINMEFYYGYDRISNTENYSVKGLGKSEQYHRNYMTDFILFVLNSIESSDIESVISSIIDFHMQYINRELPIGYYREYNSLSKYHIGEFMMDDIIDTVDNRRSLNISYNASIIQLLYTYISSVYMSK